LRKGRYAVQTEHGSLTLNSEAVTRLGERAARRPARELSIQLLGPLTVLAGVIWAVAQPYRLVFLYPEGKGFYDWLAQPPLLVMLAGVIFAVAVAPGLIDDLREGGRGSSR
jgi:hypothetical protein